jgi:hypothetical protein
MVQCSVKAQGQINFAFTFRASSNLHFTFTGECEPSIHLNVKMKPLTFASLSNQNSEFQKINAQAT